MSEHLTASIAKQAWSIFSSLEPTDNFLDAWLTVQCQMIPRAQQGWLFLKAANSDSMTLQSMFPSAITPVAEDAIRRVSKDALERKQGIVQPTDNKDGFYLAYPVSDAKAIVAVTVVRLPDAAENNLTSAMRQLQWGTVWVLEWLNRQQRFHQLDGAPDITEIFSLFSATVEPEDFGAASAALTTRLANLMRAERVSVGLKRYSTIRVVSISGVTQSNPKLDTVRKLQDAMNEAVDQKEMIVWPEVDAKNSAITRNHKSLAGDDGRNAVVTFPLGGASNIYGALTIEKASNFTQRELDICDAIAALTGPVLIEKRKNDRLLITKIADTFRSQLGKLFGPRHPVRKLVLLSLLGLAAASEYVQIPYEVSAPVVIEPAERRVITAPFEGYLLESFVRPGDQVQKGDVLAALDASELMLERIKLLADRNERTLKYQEATAKYELATAKVLKAEVNQIDARLENVNSKLDRAKIAAPIDGIVIAGDLSQSIGEPVSIGKELLELAPAKAWRMVLKVDERNIADVSRGQRGRAILAALPNSKIEFEVKRVMPLLQAEGGRNYYRVEAQFEGLSESLRPGLEGHARISTSDRSLLWIWTHDIVRWAKLQAWQWMP